MPGSTVGTTGASGRGRYQQMIRSGVVFMSSVWQSDRTDSLIRIKRKISSKGLNVPRKARVAGGRRSQ